MKHEKPETRGIPMKLARFYALAPLMLLVVIQDVGTQTSSPDSSTLPSARSVIDRFITANGGYEILESRSNVHYKMKAAKSGEIFDYEVYAANGLYYACYHYENGRVFERGFNNGVGWTRTNGAVRQCDGKELMGLIHRHQYVSSAPRWLEMYNTIECQSIESINGHETFKLHFVANDGTKIDRYFDTETGLLIRSVADEFYNTGKRNIVRDYSDHKQMGESIVAQIRTSRSQGNVYVYQVELYEFDVPIPRRTFDLPPSIAARIAKNNSGDGKRSDPKE